MSYTREQIKAAKIHGNKFSYTLLESTDIK